MVWRRTAHIVQQVVLEVTEGVAFLRGIGIGHGSMCSEVSNEQSNKGIDLCDRSYMR